MLSSTSTGVGAFVVNSPGARGLPAERYAGTKPDSEVRTPRRVPRHLELARRAEHASRPRRDWNILLPGAVDSLPPWDATVTACVLLRTSPTARRDSRVARPAAARRDELDDPLPGTQYQGVPSRCCTSRPRLSPTADATHRARHHKLSERAKSHRLSTAGDTYIRPATACSSTPALCRTALCAGGLQLSVAHTSVHRDTVLECARDVRCKAHPRL